MSNKDLFQSKPVQKNNRTKFIICLVLVGLICSITESTGKQEVIIIFEAVEGAKYYEILFLGPKNETENERTEKSTILKISSAKYTAQISDRYTVFKIRAVFSETVKTKWSGVYALKLQKEKIKEPVLPELLEVNSKKYRTILKISPPYYYKKNVLWVGPKTVFSFIPATPTLYTEKNIFYRFRRKKDIKEYSFLLFERPIESQDVLENIEDSYLIEFYSVHDNKFKGPVQNASFFVDTEPPRIKFQALKDRYLWKFQDDSFPVEVRLYSDNSLILTKKLSSGLTVFKNELASDIRLVYISVNDFLGNTAEWKFK